jgi:hypothetical protein
VVKAFLGDDAEQSVALATVGAAVGVILVGGGVVILLAAKTQWLKEDGALAESFTAGGLVAATAVTVGGASGQLWIGWKTGAELDLGGAQDWLWVCFILGAAGLCWYTFATLRATLWSGTMPPPPPKPSELAQLLALLEEALTEKDDVSNDAIPTILESVVTSYPSVGTSPGDEPLWSARRTGAMP